MINPLTSSYMKIFLALSILSIFSKVCVAQNMQDNLRFASIVTATGSTYKGEILREAGDTIFMRTNEGNPISILRENIYSIARSPSKIEDPFLDNAFAFGGSLGTPAFFNFIAEKYFGPIGLRLEGGGLFLLGFVVGWQSDLSYVLVRNGNFLLESTAIFYQNEVYSFDGGDATYHTAIGLGLSLNAGGFFFQFGIGHLFSHDQYNTIQNSPVLINGSPLTMQFGYVH